MEAVIQSKKFGFYLFLIFADRRHLFSRQRGCPSELNNLECLRRISIRLTPIITRQVNTKPDGHLCATQTTPRQSFRLWTTPRWIFCFQIIFFFYDAWLPRRHITNTKISAHNIQTKRCTSIPNLRFKIIHNPTNLIWFYLRWNN